MSPSAPIKLFDQVTFFQESISEQIQQIMELENLEEASFLHLKQFFPSDLDFNHFI